MHRDVVGPRGRVTFVGAGPGDADLITVRGWRALQSADVVLYDSLIDASLLDALDADLIFVGKRCGKHCVPQEQINDLLVREVQGGRHVVRLKGGDPTVLGRVGEEAMHVAAHGIPFSIVPGVSSVTAAPAFAGIPLTHRGVANSFTVATAHPRSDDADPPLPPYDASRTLVLLMPIRTTPSWSRRLRELGHPEDLPVAFVSAGATDRQRVLTTTLRHAVETVEAEKPASPTLVVIGRVVALREELCWFDEPVAERGGIEEENAGAAA